MPASRNRRPRPPLTPDSLNELALGYAARFATTRAKLRQYLARKLRERGWVEAERPPDLDALVRRFDRSGLVDDRAFAMAKSNSLSRRGYGKARVATALRIAGVAVDDGADAIGAARAVAGAAALNYARRRKLGPFADAAPADRKAFDRGLSAMVRAGHPVALSIAILRRSPGDVPAASELPGGEDDTAL